MRKLGFVLIVLLAFLPLVAQSHPAAHEKKVSDEITISTDLKIGGNVLTAGRYRIVCDHVTMVFTNQDNGKKLEIPCKGSELKAKSAATEVYTVTAPDGMRVVEKLYLRGSTIEHVFAN